MRRSEDVVNDPGAVKTFLSHPIFYVPLLSLPRVPRLTVDIGQGRTLQPKTRQSLQIKTSPPGKIFVLSCKYFSYTEFSNVPGNGFMHLVGIIEICQQMGFSLVIKTTRPEDPSGIITFTSNITVALKGKVSPSCLVTSRSLNVDNTLGHKYLCFLIPEVSNIGSVGQIRPISEFNPARLINLKCPASLCTISQMQRRKHTLWCIQ